MTRLSPRLIPKRARHVRFGKLLLRLSEHGRCGDRAQRRKMTTGCAVLPTNGNDPDTNSWSVPHACERAKDSRFRVTWRKVRMSSFAAHILVSTLRSRLLAGSVVAGFLAVTLIPSFSAAAPADDSIPQLGSRDFGWNANFWDFQLDPPPSSAHGPMKTDPNYPASTITQRCASRPIDSWSPSGRRIPPRKQVPLGSSKKLQFPKLV